jgi:hypothetical protein
LLAASSNIIVTNIIHFLLILTLAWIPLTVSDSIWSHNTVGRRIRLDDLEFHGMHGRLNKEQISLLDRAVSMKKVRL